MPNHVTTCLTITGDEAIMEQFIKDTIKADESGDPCFDFNGVIPRPQDIDDYDYSEEEATRQFRNVPKWYAWNHEHWGTKWNAYNLLIATQSPTKINLRFDTAWEPPMPILRAIDARGLQVRGIWRDEVKDGYYQIFGDPGDWSVTLVFGCRES